MISYTETFDLYQQFAIADLGLDATVEQDLRDALDTDESCPSLRTRIEEAITAKLREHGVADDGEWLGQWSAEQIVRSVLASRHTTARNGSDD
jgi:hypothetical protein